MLTKEASIAVAALARGILAVRPLIDVLESPIRVTLANEDDKSLSPPLDLAVKDHPGIEQLINRVAMRIGAPHFSLCSTDTYLTVFEIAVSTQLSKAISHLATFQIPASALPEIDRIVEEVMLNSFEYKCDSSKVLSFDGASLKTYALGGRNEKAVMLISACGMPAKLCERWMDSLGRDYFVITWENRGLFGEVKDFDTLAYDLNAQVEDLFAVMGHYGVKAAHLMGLCGGAVVALAAASARPGAVSSISLWHGAFGLGPDSPKTLHQDHFEALMATAALGRSQASAIHQLFDRNIITDVRRDIAHLVLYPFATAELLFRYGKLNWSIINSEIHQLLNDIHQPTLVVTSEDDSTADPAGSKWVAERLRNAFLHIEPHGDHLSLFDAEPNITEIALRFIAQNI